MLTPTAIIVGAGDALGSALARRFAREGYTVIAARRNAAILADLVTDIAGTGGKAIAVSVDARNEEEVIGLFERVEQDHGPVALCVFNIGANINVPLHETTSRIYRKVWEMAAFAGFLVGREATSKMLPRANGTMIFTGATASIRGGPGFAAFSGAKHALRALAQSMARELGPAGIHVAHAVIDGAIDTGWIRDNFPDRYASKDKDGILDPDAIAECYWRLHEQPRCAWTHELDLRPWIETW